MDIKIDDVVVTSVGTGKVLMITDRENEKLLKVEIIEPTHEANYYGAVQSGTIGFFYARNVTLYTPTEQENNVSYNKTHFIFRVSKDPCDDSAEYYAGDGRWTHSKSEAMLMTEEEANDFAYSHSSDDTVLGVGTDTDDHYLL